MSATEVITAAGDKGVIPEWDLADRMRKALRESGTAVQEMADYLDVSRGTISNWTCGRIVPDTRTLRLWAMRTGVSYDWLTQPVAVAS
jgi:transcriptional regulator with XRE-family HTH domain